MVLSSRNSGKYLSAEWAREREQCARNKDNYTVEQQAFYEISGSMGHGDNNEETFKVDSCPVDPLTSVKKGVVDIRLLPQMGGRI
jgi:hypothetical protein